VGFDLALRRPVVPLVGGRGFRLEQGNLLLQLGSLFRPRQRILGTRQIGRHGNAQHAQVLRRQLVAEESAANRSFVVGRLPQVGADQARIERDRSAQD
jgi:hypothetical protein